MDTKKMIFQIVLLAFVVCADSAELLEHATLELWVGTSATLKCRQRGQSVSAIVDDPIFLVRTPDGQTTRITDDSLKYFLASGKINSSKSLPERHYYLGISEVSEADNGMMIICISKVDSMNSESLDEQFEDWATTLKVKAYEDCPTSSSEPDFLISTEKTTNREETTSMTSGSFDSIIPRTDSLTTDKTFKPLTKSDESDPDRGASPARNQNEDQGESNSSNNTLDTMTSVVIVLAVCLILAVSACAVMYSKYRTKCWSVRNPTNTAEKNNNSSFEMENVDASNGHLPDRGPVQHTINE